MSSNKKEKRKLNNRLLDFSYRQTGFYIFIVFLLCAVSFAVPLINVRLTSSAAAQLCVCGCASAGVPAPSAWSYGAAALTGLVNVLAIVSVAIGIYSVAEAKAGSEENAETCLRIERIDDDMEDLLPQLVELQKHVKGSARRIARIKCDMEYMLLQVEDLQNGVAAARSEIKSLRSGLPTSYGSAAPAADDYQKENVDGNDN